MATIYGRLKGTADKLLKKFQQGVVKLVVPGAASGDAWNPAAPGSETLIALDATVGGVRPELVDGTNILATDLVVIFAVPSVTPMVDHKIEIDGKRCSIQSLTPLPAAGTPVAYRARVRA